MDKTGDDFIANFHNLQGSSVKKRHQNLFLLLQQHSFLTKVPETLDYITANLSPENHLEKIFYTDFLIYFQRYKELFEDFKKGDDITLHKVLRHEWFFQNAFQNLNSVEFVNSILPTMSHSVKIVVLKKISVDEEVADKLFEALCTRYGISFATAFLPKCTSHKIAKTLKKYPIKFNFSQLRNIFKKDPDLIFVYFEERTKHLGNSTHMNNDRFLELLAQKNPQIFTNLLIKHKFEVCLGYRTSKHYIDSQKSAILHKPEFFLKVLNYRAAVRRLGAEIKPVLFKKCSDCQGLYWKFLFKYYPKKHRFPIYKSTYDSIFHNKFGEDVDEIPEDILEIIPDVSEREKIAKIKLEKENNFEYLKYLTPGYCLQEFMEKIDYLTVYERAEYISIVTECCILNDDFDSLLKTFEIVCVRFKNDSSTIRDSFFATLALNGNNFLDNYIEHHWKFIMEIFATSEAKNEYIVRARYIVLKNVNFLFKNEKCIKDTVLKYPDCLFDLLENIKEHFRLLGPVINVLLEAESFSCQLALACKIYNQLNPNNTIDILNNTKFLNSIKESLEMEEFLYYDCYQRGLEYLMCQTNSSQELLELKKLYFKHFQSVGRINGLVWFLNNEPKTLLDNLNNFLTNLLETHHVSRSKLVWFSLKKCNFLELNAKMVDFCKLKLQEDGYKHKSKSVKVLAALLTSTCYLEMIKTPKTRIQFELIRYLRLTKCPEKVAPVALELCSNSKFLMNSLYSCLHKLPEITVKSYINSISQNRAVSIRKHATHLTYCLGDMETVCECFQNTTPRLVTSALKFFFRNPSESLWTIIRTKIHDLDEQNLQVLESIVNTTIPYQFKGRYIQSIWEILHKYENQQLKSMFIEKIDSECVKSLDSEFAFHLMETIFKFEETHDLVANLLIHLKDNRKFAIFSDILSKFRNIYWDSAEYRQISRQRLYKFVVTIFQKYMETETSEENFVPQFSTIFKSLFLPSEAFEENVIISCFFFKNESPEACSKFLIELNHSLCNIFGNFVVTSLADTVRNYVLPRKFSTNDEIFKFCHVMVKDRQSVDDCILILKLMPEMEPAKKESFSLYENILLEFKRMNSVNVDFALNVYLSAESFSEHEINGVQHVKVHRWLR